MIEEIVIQFLIKNGFVASAEEPIEAPEEYVIVEKTGSGKNNYIKRATLAIQTYSSTLYKTACLNEKLKETMEMLIEEDSIAKVGLNSDYNYTDTSKKKYRYQAVYEINYY